MKPMHCYETFQSFSDRETSLAKLGIDFADLFSQKGWNLYKANDPVDDWDTLRSIITQGRSCPALNNQRYILLPEVEAPDNPKQILYAIQSGKARYPFYTDVHEDGDIGRHGEGNDKVYIIDSVMFTNDRVLLQVDVNAMLYFGMWIPEKILNMNHPCIAFDILDMYFKLNQITQAYQNHQNENDPFRYKN